MLFQQLIDPQSLSYSYLLADDESGEAVLIDPSLCRIERDLELIQELGLSLRYVLETHRHAAQPSAAQLIGARTGARSVAAREADIEVRHLDTLSFGGYRIEVLATPGHTEDSLSYRVGRRVFTGDALLVRGCGKTDQGDPAVLYDSIVDVLFRLPGSTLVYPAHDATGRTSSTIEEERRFNPVASDESREQFVARVTARLA